MKRYLVFGGAPYEGEMGGFEDFICDYDSIDEAIEKANGYIRHKDDGCWWGQVVDRDTKKIILSGCS